MQMKLRKLWLCAAVLGLGSAASAQDFYLTSGSTRSMGMGGAYVASSDNVVDALATNPAGLSVLRGRNLDLSVDAVFARGSYNDPFNQNAPLDTSAGAVPYGAFGMPIGHSRFSFGVGMTPELLSEGDWKYVDPPGTAGASYGLQEQKSAINAFRFAGGLGFAVSPKFSLGATVGADYNTNTLQAPYIFQSQPVLAGLKTLLDLHTSGVGWNGSVGALAHPTDKWELGVAWKSRTVIESTGTASGDAYAQFAALGVDAASDFTYSGKVRNILPQSVTASAAWQARHGWLFAFQANWINWKDSFAVLPVTLTNGTNATINSLVGGNSMQDVVPLHWKDQYVFHGGVEHGLTENTTIRSGYAHGNNPVPSSTLTPLTAAIFTDEITAGFEYRHDRSKFGIAYGFRPMANEQVGQSSLLAGEYNNSSVNVGTQSLVASYAFKF